MKLKICATLVFLFLQTISFGQTEKLNQKNIAGKRDGKWVLYYDSNWAKIEDSTKALYFRYTYYDNGVHIYPMGPCGKKSYRLEPASLQNKKMTMLDGEYKWFDGKGRLSSVHVFKNGEYVSCKEYFKTGELSQFFDYTKKCPGQMHGWTVIIYDKKGNITLESPTCKDKNGNWPKMRG